MRSRIGDGYGGGTRRRGRISVMVVLAAIVVLAGCYYRKYDKLLRTHVDVLTAMAGKIEDLTARDGVPPPALGEYRYPLERARDFARIAARRFEGRASLTAFRALCDAYERILAATETVRGAPESAAGRSAFAAALTDFRARADATLGALRDERGAAAADLGPFLPS